MASCRMDHQDICVDRYRNMIPVLAPRLRLSGMRVRRRSQGELEGDQLQSVSLRCCSRPRDRYTDVQQSCY